MAAVPIKPEYGPTLGRLLAPRWRAAPAALRRGLLLGLVALVALVGGLVLRALPAHYSQGGSMPFSFSYKDLYRTTPEAGGYVRVISREADGSPRYSFAVDPIVLPPYRGQISGELPLFATGYEARLAARFPGFVLRGEGRTRVNEVPGYQILFSAGVQGHEVLGRDILLLPVHEGVRRGVSLVVLGAVKANPQVLAPSEVASEGALLRPLKTFSFG
jgi:hypothetical protein